jgi:hypothetical protein
MLMFVKGPITVSVAAFLGGGCFVLPGYCWGGAAGRDSQFCRVFAMWTIWPW